MDQLRDIAEENSRSINKEIEFLIKKHIEAHNQDNSQDENTKKENGKTS